MRTSWAAVAVATVALFVGRARAQEGHAAPEAEHSGAVHTAAHEGSEHDVGPVMPDTHHRWPGLLLMTIATMFAWAAAVGIVSRLHAPPEELPPTHSHDEPPGASHHHGATGTLNPDPDADHGHRHHH